MKKLIDLDSGYFKHTAKILLEDKTTKKNITWSTKTYEHLGEDYAENAQIEKKAIVGLKSYIVQPRVYKSQTEQAERTKKKAEVFTPTWLCNKMNNFCDEEWFGRKGVFNTENEDNTWTVNTEKIEFTGKKTWKNYVDSRRLEITCGEAPYLVSRYDATTGDIIDIENRIGILDRKMRVVNENATDEEWMKWTIRAFQSTYGYEYQGDNLLIARVNMLMSFADYYENKWGRIPEADETRKLANIIAWNLWQMDGLKGIVPQIIPEKKEIQLSLEGVAEIETTEEKETVECKYMNWRKDNSFLYSTLKERKMKFDFVIGNPPYQENIENREEQPPIYHKFYDASTSIADATLLITPARFLFDAGKTPHVWNIQMLNNEHFKVLEYFPYANQVFTNTEIKGGVAISYLDKNNDYGAIEVFLPYAEMNSVLKKVKNISTNYLESIVYSNTSYKFSDLFYKENPNFWDRVSGGSRRYLSSPAFEKFPEVLYSKKPNDNREYALITGRKNNQREQLFLLEDYLNPPDNYNKYKIFISSSNGSGHFGETLTLPFVAGPKEGATETFMSLGCFDEQSEAENLIKFIKTKFARAMLGTKKVTQGLKNSRVWSNVPLQDFTENSDINWTVSVKEIDKQLYKKYGLNEEEIAFIESKVKEME